MKDITVEYEESFMEFLESVIPEEDIVNATFTATIDGGILILPDVYVLLTERVSERIEERIADYLDEFIFTVAEENCARYEPEPIHIVVEDYSSMYNKNNTIEPFNDWY